MKRTICALILLIGFSLPGPGSNLRAQGAYRLLVQGQASPFDTAVAIQVKTYRLESAKMEAADRVIKGQKKTILSLSRSLDIARQEGAAADKQVGELEKRAADDARTKAELYSHIAALEKEVNKKPGIFASPKFWGPLGLLIGTLLFK